MLKKRMQRVAEQGARALNDLNLIRAAIVALDDEDLLDFADIFKEQPGTPLNELASVEMAKRNISLAAQG